MYLIVIQGYIGFLVLKYLRIIFFQTLISMNVTINGAARCYDRPFKHGHELSSETHTIMKFFQSCFRLNDLPNLSVIMKKCEREKKTQKNAKKPFPKTFLCDITISFQLTLPTAQYLANVLDFSI